MYVLYCIVLYCTPVHAWPVGKKHSATQLCVTPFANGRTGLGFSRTKNVLAFFSHSGRKMLALNIDDLQTYTCRASTAPLLRLIWPSRPHSGRRSWDRQRCRLWRQLLSMLPRKRRASIRPTFVLSKGFASSPWWPNLQEPGTVRPVTSCFRSRGAPQHELVKTLVSSMGTYFRNSVSSCGATGCRLCAPPSSWMRSQCFVRAATFTRSSKARCGTPANSGTCSRPNKLKFTRWPCVPPLLSKFWRSSCRHIPICNLRSSSVHQLRSANEPFISIKPWKGHRQAESALKALNAGYQLKRGAAKPLLELEMEPGEAVHFALQLVHPFSRACSIAGSLDCCPGGGGQCSRRSCSSAWSGIGSLAGASGGAAARICVQDHAAT